MMYRPDVVMAWLSALCGDRREPWEFSREWLLVNGLHDLEPDPAQVTGLAAFMERRGYFK